MPERTSTPITKLIIAARDGGEAERDALFDAVYAELKAIARADPFVGRAGDTLQPTVLISEVFLEIERRFPPPPKGTQESRATFYRSAALAMRGILRDHWRANGAAKRGGGKRPAGLDDQTVESDPGGFELVDFLALDEALTRLETFNARWYEVVMHRYFGGRTTRETAEFLGVAPSTVASDWMLARSWLAQEIERTSE